MFAICTFSAISPCYLGMEVRRCVEFTGVELTSGAEVAAPMEKAVTGPVEKAATFRSGEKDGPRAGEGSSGQEAP
jgi:hypothetical protein